MTSPFVHNLLKPLALSRPSSPTLQYSPDTLITSETQSKKTLRSLLVELNGSPISETVVNDTIGALIQIERSTGADAQTLIEGTDAVEEESLKQAVINRLVVGMYAESLDTFILQATQAEAEAEWWAYIERSRRKVAWYLLQSEFSCLLIFRIEFYLHDNSFPCTSRSLRGYGCPSFPYPKCPSSFVEPQSYPPSPAVSFTGFLPSGSLHKNLVSTSSSAAHLCCFIDYPVFFTFPHGNNLSQPSILKSRQTNTATACIDETGVHV